MARGTAGTHMLRMYVLLPPMLGPVMVARRDDDDRSTSFGMNDIPLWACIHHGITVNGDWSTTVGQQERNHCTLACHLQPCVSQVLHLQDSVGSVTQHGTAVVTLTRDCGEAAQRIQRAHHLHGGKQRSKRLSTNWQKRDKTHITSRARTAREQRGINYLNGRSQDVSVGSHDLHDLLLHLRLCGRVLIHHRQVRLGRDSQLWSCETHAVPLRHQGYHARDGDAATFA